MKIGEPFILSKLYFVGKHDKYSIYYAFIGEEQSCLCLVWSMDTRVEKGAGEPFGGLRQWLVWFFEALIQQHLNVRDIQTSR